jgi:hypothetical protein
MSRFDAVTWLNALSAREGRTPYYYTSAALTAPISNSYVYRPLMKTLGEGSGQVWAHASMIAWPPYGTNNAANERDVRQFRQSLEGTSGPFVS